MKNKYIVFVAMGIELVGIMVGCLLLGQKLDELYDLRGLAMIGLSMAGLAGWIFQIVMLAKRADSSQPGE
ncbi:MAG: AtpZ/AtpI family protein [Pseudobdellovibrionaceae bacterium]